MLNENEKTLLNFETYKELRKRILFSGIRICRSLFGLIRYKSITNYILVNEKYIHK
jgi:hypothetical protein